ncbi:hypothetical protein ACRQ5D_29155 [Mucilaginibacter sp. P25]|uniref:SGNH/GDSL hydrolase family protein n=1 Tax=Mucilaginibacter gossypii TaxID=551996 RepID=A0A1G7NKG3_9SPHI|nr:hypothetical protein [Mucilaginibacter gossypii]SDF74564.1 hypothetical protein SAMN05192573_101274 [Mucilaginibacter gossypii]
MHRFLIKTISFVLVSCLLILAIALIPGYMVNKFSKFRVKKDNTIALFGHSHSECAYNDTLIPKLTNLSHSAESYFYTFQKVKKYLSQNPQITTVLIEFSNNQIDTKMDDWTWGYTYMSNMFPQYASFMSPADFELLAKHNSKYFMNCVGIAARTNFIKALSFNYDYTGKTGGYFKIEGSRLLPSNNPAGKNIKTASNKSVISTTNIQYLRKIIDYCNGMHKSVFLIRSPQHPLYEYRNNEAEFSLIRERYFNDIKFLDFNNFPLKNDDFADFGHLNFKGALKFSAYINQRIINGMLNTVNTASLSQLDNKTVSGN